MQLLRDIRQIFDEREITTITPTTLADALALIEEAPWATWNRGKPISSNRIGRFLSAYEIKSQRGRTARHYIRADFEDAWASYCAETPSECVTSVTSVTALKSREISVADFSGVTDQCVTGADCVTEMSNEIYGVADVTDVTQFEEGFL